MTLQGSHHTGLLHLLASVSARDVFRQLVMGWAYGQSVPDI